jgi:hypothetical protein
VDRDSSDVVTTDLDLAGVKTGPNLGTEIGSDGAGAAQRAGRAVEHGEDPVPGRLHQTARMVGDEPARRRVVRVQELAPLPVTAIGGATSRIDDVSEQHSGQHPCRWRRRARASHELLELVEPCVLIANLREVVHARHLDQPSTRNAGSQLPAGSDRDDRVVGPVHDERRHGDDGEHSAHVEPVVHLG